MIRRSKKQLNTLKKELDRGRYVASEASVMLKIVNRSITGQCHQLMINVKSRRSIHQNNVGHHKLFAK